MAFPDNNRRPEDVRTGPSTGTQPYDPRGVRWWDPANMVLAIWLFISPWVLQFGTNLPAAGSPDNAASTGIAATAAWNAWVLGVLVFLVALSAMGRLARGQEWINLILGIWIFIAPWVLGFATSAYGPAAWDHWIVGALVIIVSALAIAQRRQERYPGAMRTEATREPFRR